MHPSADLIGLVYSPGTDPRDAFGQTYAVFLHVTTKLLCDKPPAIDLVIGYLHTVTVPFYEDGSVLSDGNVPTHETLERGD